MSTAEPFAHSPDNKTPKASHQTLVPPEALPALPRPTAAQASAVYSLWACQHCQAKMETPWPFLFQINGTAEIV